MTLSFLFVVARAAAVESTVCLFCFVRTKLSAECSQQFFFNRIDPLETSPCELSSAVKKNE
jgi:hypothetical protein